VPKEVAQMGVFRKNRATAVNPKQPCIAAHALALNMKIERVNQWLTLLANFGVMIGIIFLILELNQNTQALRANAIQNSTELAREQVMMFSQDADVVRITLVEDLDELSDIDRRRAFWINRSFVTAMMGLYRQWTLGMLPDEEWENWTRIICSNAANPNFYKLWNPSTLIPSFVQYVEHSCGRT
jgi:hypothetical protein